MEIKEKTMSVNETEGFCKIEKFDGVSSLIDVEKLVELMDLFKWLKKRGIEAVHIGVSEKGLLIFFLDEELTVGYVICPLERG